MGAEGVFAGCIYRPGRVMAVVFCKSFFFFFFW